MIDIDKQLADLWREWFKEKKDPLCHYDEVVCHFCDALEIGDVPVEHAPDCIYFRAKVIIDQEKEWE